MRLQEASRQLEQPIGIQTSDGLQSPSSPDQRMISARTWDELTDEIRSRPGFEHFLKPRSFGEMTAAVQDGPVVFLNLAKTRCDALVFSSDERGLAHALVVPLERVTLQKTKDLSKTFVELLTESDIRARDFRAPKHSPKLADKNASFKQGLKTLWLDHAQPVVKGLAYQASTSSLAPVRVQRFVERLAESGVRDRDVRKHRQRPQFADKEAAFKQVLRALWVDYVQPVVEGLAYQVDTASPPRLWWCTTGSLAFLPLHAAGDYDSKEAGNKLSDYVVSSYTPTLTALLDRSPSRICDEPKILTVAMSKTPGGDNLPNVDQEVGKIHQIATNVPTISLSNEGATKNRVLEELQQSNWVHLACHGQQIGGRPMESGLVLQDGMLELSQIVKTRLSTPDFAFLSACQTAVGDEGVPEESAHLAAGMLFAGYRGVVATMWSIQDDIAPRVAEEFYRYMFRNGKSNREEAAYALHRAMRSLQDSGVGFESWVPFIYMGR